MTTLQSFSMQPDITMLHCIQSMVLVYYKIHYWIKTSWGVMESSLTFMWKSTSNMIWHRINQSSTTRIVHALLLSVTPGQFCHLSTRCLPPPMVMLIGGSRSDGRGAARLDVLQVAGVAEKVAVQRVAAMTLLVIQLHLTFLNNKKVAQRWDTSTERLHKLEHWSRG